MINDGPVGAVLVVGAGIGGMQASLDLAEAGLKVYLLERSPAIGGGMAQLDKTFPTNDCAMCIMSPKLVEVGRHLNIDILTTSTVESITGEPGNFTVKIRRLPRFVNLEKCTGCGDCAEVCPVVRPDGFNRGLSTRKAIYKPYPQAIPNAFAIEKVGTAPCREVCPIHQRAQGYIALIRAGRFADAYRTILEDNPFPSICGRVCNHRCEEACSRLPASTPVNIKALKRFVTDWYKEHSDQYPVVHEETRAVEDRGFQTSKKVAVVGAGPAGLACARSLVRKGHAVTVFEALPVPGGMMRVGIPEFRLPAEIVQQEIDAILSEGVELVLNRRIDDVPGLLRQGYEAVFVAIGAHQGVRLPIPGADLPGVTTAVEFLKAVNLRSFQVPYAASDPPPIGGQRSSVSGQFSLVTNLQSPISNKRVLVLGGGNVAVDAALSAVRLGASWVGMACLESREQMPASAWEIRDAVEEDIQLFPSRTFKEITSSNGNVTGVRCNQVNFRGFIEGRPDFDEIPGTEEFIPADQVIFAIGQRPEIGCLQGQVETIHRYYPRVEPETLSSQIPGIFCGGDAVTGTTFIVDAIAAGQKAAEAIDRYLQGALGYPLDPGAARPAIVDIDPGEILQRLRDDPNLRAERAEPRPRPPAERRRDFNEIYAGLTEEEARAEAARCLGCGVCSECLQCEYTCRAGAINHNEREELVDLQVGAVILAPGLEPVPGGIRPEYGYARYPNVVTNLEFERMLSASGPFGGIVQRPSDGAHPNKIAWIQCVGSRDVSCSQGYCSSVCCMVSTKEAVIAREHDPRIAPSIFYIDLRAFGKGFDPYIELAEHEHGVRYVRSMVSAVKEVPNSRNLRLSYATFEEGGRPVSHEEEFELVVLAVGLRPPAEAREMAERLGIKLNEWGFAEPPPGLPGASSRAGIFVAGGFSEPKDIPETVVEASCAAARASALLAGGRDTLTLQPVYPPERDVSEEAARVGVFVCHCGINIGGVVDVPEVVEYARSLPGVVYAERNLYTCSQDTQQKISALVLEQGLNRVVVASCTPRTHEPLFQDTIRQAGLNPHLFEMANIREQDAWVHRSTPEVATEKAKQLVAMAVAKARRLRSIQRGTLEMEHRALVIGGGLAGMTAALSIAAQGFPVFLVEKEARLGGHLRHIYFGTNGGDPQRTMRGLIETVNQDARITLLLESEVVDVSGYVGQYRTIVQAKDGARSELRHGVIVVATGGWEILPKAYGYGQLPGVITQRELETWLWYTAPQNASQPPSAAPTGEHTATLLTDAPPEPALSNPPLFPYSPNPLFPKDDLSRSTLASIVMIQCVGSRDEHHPYCSRVCCTQAMKNAVELKRRSPQTAVTILYRDIRSYGFRERLYREARRLGVLFLPFEASRPPEISQADGRLQVRVVVQPDGQTLTLTADQVVLSAGIEAEPGNEALSRLLKLPLTADGFFLEAHVKLRPVDFAADGVYLCGLAHSPRAMEETVAQAQAAAVRAVALLSKKELSATPTVAVVNPRLCSACGLCIEVCPYGARRLEPEAGCAEVVEVLCQGCGACVAACPNKASQQKGFEFLQVADMIDEALR